MATVFLFLKLILFRKYRDFNLKLLCINLLNCSLFHWCLRLVLFHASGGKRLTVLFTLCVVGLKHLTVLFTLYGWSEAFDRFVLAVCAWSEAFDRFVHAVCGWSEV